MWQALRAAEQAQEKAERDAAAAREAISQAEEAAQRQAAATEQESARANIAEAHARTAEQQIQAAHKVWRVPSCCVLMHVAIYLPTTLLADTGPPHQKFDQPCVGFCSRVLSHFLESTSAPNDSDALRAC